MSEDNDNKQEKKDDNYYLDRKQGLQTESSLEHSKLRYERKIEIEKQVSQMQAAGGSAKLGAIAAAKQFLWSEDEDDTVDCDSSDGIETVTVPTITATKKSWKGLMSIKLSTSIMSSKEKDTAGKSSQWKFPWDKKEKIKEETHTPPPHAFNLAPRKGSLDPYSAFDGVDDSIGKYDSEYHSFNLHRSDSTSSNSISRTIAKQFCNEKDDEKLSRKSRLVFGTIFGFIFALTAMLLIITFVFLDEKEAEAEAASVLSKSITNAESITAAKDFFDATIPNNKNNDIYFLSPPPPPIINELRYDKLLLFLLLKNYTSLQDLETPGTPQNYALWWLTDQDTAQLQPPSLGTKTKTMTIIDEDDDDYSLSSLHLLQRYTLVVLYYSTCCDGGNTENPQYLSLIDHNDSEQQEQEDTTAAAATDLPDITNYWDNDRYWMTGRNVCDWYGVVCSNNDDNIIDVLNLTQNNLHGTIASELVILGRNLRVLDFGRNRLHGTVPPRLLSSMTQLRLLSLEHNQLTGTISTTAAAAEEQHLYRVYLSHNNLTGPINFMNNLSNNLRDLYLNNNQFTGTIPTTITTQLLQHWDISRNQLTGTLSSTLFSSPSSVNLISFQFHSNMNLSGTLPTELGRLTKLQLLEGEDNKFTGTIPSELGQMTELQVLQLNHNRLHGNFPYKYLCNIPMHIIIDCHDNDMSNDTIIHNCHCCKFCGEFSF